MLLNFIKTVVLYGKRCYAKWRASGLQPGGIGCDTANKKKKTALECIYLIFCCDALAVVRAKPI